MKIRCWCLTDAQNGRPPPLSLTAALLISIPKYGGIFHQWKLPAFAKKANQYRLPRSFRSWQQPAELRTASFTSHEKRLDGYMLFKHLNVANISQIHPSARHQASQKKNQRCKCKSDECTCCAWTRFGFLLDHCPAYVQYGVDLEDHRVEIRLLSPLLNCLFLASVSVGADPTQPCCIPVSCQPG